MSDPFHAYDIRGVYGQDVTTELAYQVGYATVQFLEAKRFVVGYDGRTSSPALAKAVCKGASAAGAQVTLIGLCTTPQFYFSLYSGTKEGGIMVTASHNPGKENGFKICSANAKPIFIENGLEDIKQLASQVNPEDNNEQLQEESITSKYTTFFKKLAPEITPKKILIDCGNGVGRLEVDVLKEIYGEQIHIDVLYPQINGTFPNHDANPVVLSNTEELQNRLAKTEYDLGFAFDGDADRIVCFLPDGTRVEPDILTGILGVALCNESERIGYEVRTSQSVINYLKEHNREGVLMTSGHAYMKLAMHEHAVRFAGEKSGHYFYQHLHYTDSTLLTIMQVLKLIEKKFIPEVQTVQAQKVRSEEINVDVQDKEGTLKQIQKAFSTVKQLDVDGVSVIGQDYFFNVRKSNTEDLLRINLEADSQKVFNAIKEKLTNIIR
jgi:phosphomannomutase